MTLPIRPWVLQPTPDPAAIAELQAHYHPLIATLLWQRGVRSLTEADVFFRPQFPDHLGDPFLFYQMQEAIDTIVHAIREKSLIMVHGDYDADGVTSTVAMVETLRALGGRVEWYVPDRFTEGYGLKKKTIQTFIHQGVQLLITVDCGSTNVDEIAMARAAGMEVVVLDHHQQPAKLPEATAIINPVFEDERYPFRHHASAGVVFTVVRALLKSTNYGQTLGLTLAPGWEKWLLDLVAIATVADMMPIVGENRLFVSFGLKVLSKTRRPGLRALLSSAGIRLDEVTEVTLGFHIGPRLNAAGRLQHASTAVRLLLTDDPAEAEKLAHELEQLNDDRKRLTELATAEAWDHIQKLGEQAGYAVFAPHWSAGVLGLVAGRLADKLNRPVFVMTSNDQILVGSGRAGSNLDIMAIMNAGQHLFAQYGGHTGACGFTLAVGVTPEAVNTWMKNHIAEQYPVVEAKPLSVDLELQLQDISADFLTALDQLAPFGLSSQRPILLVKEVEIRDAQRVGTGRQHLRLRVHNHGSTRAAIGFRLGERWSDIQGVEKIDLAVEPSWNEWQGRKDIQLRIIDVRGTTYDPLAT